MTNRFKYFRNTFFNMKILKIFIILFLLFMPMVIAQQTDCEFSIPPVQLNTCTELIQTCSNCTDGVNLTALYYPHSNGTVLYPNDVMTQNQNNYNYTFCDTSTLGTYIYSTEGSPNGIPTTGNVCFLVTPNGDTLSLVDILVYSLIFFISLLVFIFFFHKTIQSENPNYKISFFILTYLIYVVLIFLIYRMSVDYLPAFTYLNVILFYVLLISIMLIFPLFILSIAFLLKTQFESLREKELRKRGHSDEEIEKRKRR